MMIQRALHLVLFGFTFAVPVLTLGGQPRRGVSSPRRPGPTVPPPGPHVRNNAVSAPVRTSLVPANVDSVLPRHVGTLLDTLSLAITPRRDTSNDPRPGLPTQGRTLPNRALPRTRLVWRLLAGTMPAPAALTPAGGRGSPVFAAPATPLVGLDAEIGVLDRAQWYLTAAGGLAGVPRPTGLQLGRARPQAEYQLVTAMGATGLLIEPFRGWWTPIARLGVGMRLHWMDLPTVYAWQLATASEVGAGIRVRTWRIETTLEGRWWSSTFDAARLPIAGLRGNLAVPVRDVAILGGVRLFR